ncbi:MAG: type 1 glutamine amidotransferase [Actinomycetes bacterium]
MRVLIIEHDHVSPPGPVAQRFRHHGFDVDEFLVVPAENFADPNVKREFPDLANYDVIVPMGAPWGAWEDERIGNWLLPELEFLTQAIAQDTPIFGICFGGQLLARALGGSVAPGPKPEIGWTVIHSDRPDLVSAGPWFQFHYDRWKLSGEAFEVARNSVSSQAFTHARNLGVQFHPELTTEMLTGWLNNGGRELVIADGQDPDILLAHTEAEQAAAEERTNQLVDTFLRDVAKLI